MVDLDRLKQKAAMAYVGCRVDPETKAWLIDFCTREQIPLSKLLVALIDDFRRDHQSPQPQDEPTK